MARNPYWSSYYAGLTTTLIGSDGTPAAGFAASTSSYYEYDAYSFGSLTATDTLDFLPVTMQTGSAYTFVGTGTYQLFIELFDSEGYLLLSVDGDDIGAYDSYPTDSIVTFQPEVSGTYYVMIGYEFDDYAGAWGVGVARDIGNDGVNSLTAPATPTTPAFSTVYGSAGADALAGSAGADEMRGYEGDDALTGGDGSDLIYGNQGLDTVSAGTGDDTVYGGQNGGALTGNPAVYRTGVEHLYGDSGNDVMYGNFGPDLLYAGDGDDRLFGGQDDDTISGGAGSDSLYGNLGNDLMYGDAGADRFVKSDGADVIGDFSYADGDRLSVPSLLSLTGTTDVAGGALLSFADGSSIQLVGVSASSVVVGFFV